MLRRCWPVVWIVWVVCLGCHSLAGLESEGTDNRARRLWQEGQAAMQAGKPDLAIPRYQESLAQDPGWTWSYLSLAAAYLEKGNDAEAAVNLARFVKARPDHVEAQIHLAELLLRLKRESEARTHFEQSVANAQDRKEPSSSYLIRCHSGLMEAAEQRGDLYEAELNRGLGLYWLAQSRANLGDPEGDLPAEGLLWRAAGQLLQARKLCPNEARPNWYLYLVWHSLGQSQRACACLHQAEQTAPFSCLTPAEQRGLHLAVLLHDRFSVPGRLFDCEYR
jgi:tetratricopeptide (TPR) repeat protein